jgi:hypothetical protein
MKILTSLILLAWALCVQAGNFQVPLSQKSVKIDGILDDEIWQQALQIDLIYEIDPSYNIKAEVDTRVYIIDNGSSILFAFKAQDPHPEKIRAFLRDRDSAFQDDFVGVMLDTYNDERRALEFFVNPLGVQMDLIRDDADNGREDDSWDAIWDSAGKISSDGYVVEMKIPYNELQMPTKAGKKTWGINLFRSYPRTVRKQLQAVKLDRNNSCFLCQLDKFIGFENAQRGLDLEITPSVTAISQQRREGINGDFSSLEHNIEPSLDINWGINSNLTLNATFNPDFSQVESDSAQLDVNQTFALFFPEKRPFFLENSDFFNTRLRLIHTRNIADPDYGIRLVGKSGKNAYGFFYTDDTITNILIPGVFGSGLTSLNQSSENLAARYRRDFGNSSTVGALVTSRSSGDYDNTVVSVDSKYRLTDKNSIQFQYAHSETSNPQQIIDDFEQQRELAGDVYTIRYEHDDENLFYAISHTDYDDDFRADLGFISKTGFNKSIAGIQYTWRPATESWWNRLRVYTDWDITHDQTGRLLERELEGNIQINANKQSYLSLSGLSRQQLWNDILFDENRVGIDTGFKPNSSIDIGTGYSYGDSIDFSNTKIAKRTGAYVFTNLNIGKHFSMRINHSFRKLERDGGNVFIANQSDIRLSYQFNIRQRLRLAIINTNINRDTDLYDFEIDSHSRSLGNQLIYSYKVNPKTLLFLGYSDSSIEDQNIDLTTTNRTFFAKFSYAWKK